MLKQCKKILGALLIASFILPLSASLAAAQTGIPAHYMDHYRHAKQVLQKQYPDFLSAFHVLQEGLQTIDSSNKQTQQAVLMTFFPFIEDMTNMNSYVADERDENGVLWTLQTEVVVSFFAMNLNTLDGAYTSVNELVREAFVDYSSGADSAMILSEDELIQKHSISREEAQRIRNVLHKLYQYPLMP